MFKALHESLMQKSPLYAKWHHSPEHTVIHFFVLTIIASICAGYISLCLNYAAYNINAYGNNIALAALETPEIPTLRTIVFPNTNCNERPDQNTFGCHWYIPERVDNIQIMAWGGGGGGSLPISCKDGITAADGGGGAAYSDVSLAVKIGHHLNISIGKHGKPGFNGIGTSVIHYEDDGLVGKEILYAEGAFDTTGGKASSGLGDHVFSGGDGGIGVGYNGTPENCTIKVGGGGGGGGAGGPKGKGQNGENGKKNERAAGGAGTGSGAGNGGFGGLTPPGAGVSGTVAGGGKGGSASNAVRICDLGEGLCGGGDGKVIITYYELPPSPSPSPSAPPRICDMSKGDGCEVDVDCGDVNKFICLASPQCACAPRPSPSSSPKPSGSPLGSPSPSIIIHASSPSPLPLINSPFPGYKCNPTTFQCVVGNPGETCNPVNCKRSGSMR